MRRSFHLPSCARQFTHPIEPVAGQATNTSSSTMDWLNLFLLCQCQNLYLDLYRNVRHHLKLSIQFFYLLFPQKFGWIKEHQRAAK